MTNNAARGGQGINIIDDDGVGHFHQINGVSADGTMALARTYDGDTDTGLAYEIVPVLGEMNYLAEQISLLIESSASIAGLVLFEKDIIQFDGSAYAARTLIQYFTDLSNALAEVDVPSAATCDIGAASSPKVRITGSVTITSLGTGTHRWRLVRFADVLTLTHNATSLILPGNANIVTVEGDQAQFVSNGAGNWRCINYQRQATAP